ncbi:GPI inositol-deacylase [Linum perenne]
MQGFKAKLRVAIPVVLTLWISLLGLYGLLKPISNGCAMTYMYPTYIPISTTASGDAATSGGKYGLYLYHEGWKKIDFEEHIKQLSGVPVLFIPGNGGSFKQAMSLAAECERAYQGGPLERTFHHEANLTPEEGGVDMHLADFQLPSQYSSKIDWFAVDLEGEHSAMDGQILDEHTEYVVYAIHRILDQYKHSHDVREKEGAASSGALPKSVILVGHSMGGFVARAAIIHPRLRKSAVNTILTLSTPHQLPPVALQPSLGHYFACVNNEWRKGYEVQTTQAAPFVSDPLLSNVIVVSISGAYNDYQVRTKLETLKGIVPPTHGFMISSTGMRNVWLSMEHQAILWCNQLVIQVSHTLLSLIDARTGLPFSSTQKRLSVFSRMLRSGIPDAFHWTSQPHPHDQSTNLSAQAASQVATLPGCPKNLIWNDDGLEKDLYIQTSTMTVLAMDGRRRWLDIHKLGSNGKSHFVFVTNLAPCSGVRLHLWSEKGKSNSDLPSRKIVEVTSKLVQIPSGPAPVQAEPGRQTEQAPPSAVLCLTPEDMQGFRFLTVSIAPRPTVSGRPPPPASMAVGQFFDPKEGERKLSAPVMLLSAYSSKDMVLEEDHPLAFNLSFDVSLGLLPTALSLETTGCGIKRSGLPDEEAGDIEASNLCRLRCFPPVAVAWDPTSGLHIFPTLYSETVIVDSSPALLSSFPGSEKSSILLLVDPHCSYKLNFAASQTAAAGRFLLLYGSQMVAFCFAAIFFALMQQVRAWNLDLPIPSVLAAMASNLRMPLPFMLLGFTPILVSLFLSILNSQPLPSIASFIVVSIICYLFANGVVFLLVLGSQSLFYAAAFMHVILKSRWQQWETNFRLVYLRWFITLSARVFSLKAMRVIRASPSLVTALTAVTLGCFVHPALGLLVLLLADTLCCHSALSSFLTASFRSSHTRKKEFLGYEDKDKESCWPTSSKHEMGVNHNAALLEENSSNSPNSSKSFSDTQLEIFHHRHGLLILHLMAALMFVPSFVAWLQRIGMGHSFPWLLDSTMCIGVVLHGVFFLNPDFNSLFSFVIWKEVKLDAIYLVAGIYSYIVGLGLAPYKVFYPIAVIGFLSFAVKLLHQRSKDNGEPSRLGRKKHSHRH